MIEPIDLRGHDVIGVLSNTSTSLFAPHMQFSRAPRKHPLGGCGEASGAYQEQQCWRAAAPKRFGTAGWFRGGQFFHGPVGSGDDSRTSHLSTIITSAPPQVTRRSILEAGDPCSRGSQGPLPTCSGLVMQPPPGKRVPRGSPGLQNRSSSQYLPPSPQLPVDLLCPKHKSKNLGVTLNSSPPPDPTSYSICKAGQVSFPDSSLCFHLLLPLSHPNPTIY